MDRSFQLLTKLDRVATLSVKRYLVMLNDGEDSDLQLPFIDTERYLTECIEMGLGSIYTEYPERSKAWVRREIYERFARMRDQMVELTKEKANAQN